MIFILLTFLLICLIGVCYSRKGNKDFFNQQQTNCVRGIFALIIFMSHFNSYFPAGLGGVGDSVYLGIIRNIGQMMVAPFLFISGYGIFLSSRKKKNYINEFPKKRILKTFVFFALAVLLYLIYNLTTGQHYDLATNLLAFAGWTSIGNSNWFMFAILFLYIATYASALLTKKEINNRTIAIISAITLIYVLVMHFVQGGDHWWYDTVLCFPAGLLFASLHDKIRDFYARHRLISASVSVASFALLFIISKHIGRNLPYAIIYNLLSCAFCLLIARICFSISFGNPVPMFLGTYGFEIYILQRIPHSFFSPMFSNNAPLCFFISLASTILISIVFKWATSIIFAPHKKRVVK